MAGELVIVPSNGEPYVELAKTDRRQGRLFRKHILNMGTLKHPKTGEDIAIDDTFVKTMKKNFDNGVCDIVQVPLANDNNEHTEDPTRNIGEVVDIQVADKKVYAVIDVRDATHADKLGKTYLGASAMMHLDYTDTKSGTKVGPTLLHSCVTNRPYVTGLDGYEEIVKETVAATSDRSGEAVVLLAQDTPVVSPPTKETDMPDAPNVEEPTKATLEELLSALKTDHGIDVSALQAQAGDNAKAAELSQTLVKALTDAGVVKLSADADTKVVGDTVVGAVAELANNNVALTKRVNSLERRDAENAVEALVGEGRVMPSQRNAFVELKLTNPGMFDALVPAEPLVKLNNEAGRTPPDDAAHRKDMDAEIIRLTELATALNAPVAKK